MKLEKVIKITTVILLVVIIALASFLGIYEKGEYKVRNKVPNYILGMEFSNSRIVDFEVDKTIESTKIYDKDGNEITEKEDGVEYTEENGYTTVEDKVNSEDILTKENYDLCKKILKKRLNALGAEQYNIKENNTNGNIQIEMTENDNTNDIISNLSQKGVFELKDNETDEVLLDNSYINDCKVVYGQTETGNTVYLQIVFNKEGKEKLKEISQKYVATTAQTLNEDGELEDTQETKEVSIVFDGETYRTTYFGETITDGTLNVALGSGNDSNTINEYAKTATQMAVVLNSGVLPIIYNVSGYVVSSETTKGELSILAYVALVILLIMVIYSIVKLRLNGILVAILEIGYISLLLLALRYTNIKITLEGIVGIVVSTVLSYMYIYSAFKNSADSFIKDTTAKFALKLIPIYIIAIIFTFNKVANISSLGMTLVWGIITMYLYNLILTQITVKTIENK